MVGRRQPSACRLAAAVAGLALLVSAVAGCDARAAARKQVRAAFDTRATQVAHDWEASATAAAWRRSLVILSDITWRPYPHDRIPAGVFVDTPTLGALQNAWYLPDLPPGQPSPPSGVVTFGDGGTLTVPLRTASAALHDFAQPGPCKPSATPPVLPVPPDGATADCPRARITGAVLATRHVMTGRGEADVPVWRYTIPGLAEPVEHVAVDPSAMLVPDDVESEPVFNNFSAGFEGVDSLKGVDRTALTLRITTEGPYRDVYPLVYEDADVVVVGYGRIGPEGGHGGSVFDGGSAGIGPLDVTLRSPVGNRVVLDVTTGHPLFLRTFP